MADRQFVQPGSVEDILKRAFGARLPDVKACCSLWIAWDARRSVAALRCCSTTDHRAPLTQAAMEALADAIPVDHVGKAAFSLYERFRPEFNSWGVPGELSFAGIRALADSWERP